MAGLIHFFQYHAWKSYVDTQSDLVSGWEDIDPPVPRQGGTGGTLKLASHTLLETARLTMTRDLKEG
ncbi:hypothetical protein HK13_05045 [Acetobacter indonesiensis]|uniref:hypothetical protein n=1 Tax=Acetobacter indonesiensis TaxID=104101 RepID=UPI000A36BFBB|nr:hypothetical protein [Acetobacter indonesiensis]OUI94483.1 hypothetical protein HK13_05045 [Acetobacter indonesiensis]